MVETRFEGIVIGHADWGDVDRLISFYTPHQGRVEAVARGVRYEKSKLKCHLDVLSHGEFCVVKNRGRGVITDALALGTFDAARSTVRTGHAARAVAALYDAYLFQGSPDGALWDALTGTLKAVADSAEDGNDPGPALQRFAETFLAALGYHDGEPRARDPYAYDALLAHTDIAGPTFSALFRDIQALSSVRVPA